MSRGRAEPEWLVAVRAQLVRGEIAAAQSSLATALAECPDSVELRRAQAGVFLRTGHRGDAERLLRALLKENAGDAASAFALARMLKEQGRTAGAASTLRACFADTSNVRDANLAITAVELLDDCGRKVDAAAIADLAIGENPDDARLHAYAGMLQIQLGEFDLARRRYLFALEHDERAWEWHVPIGLSSAQRYTDADHPDLGLYHDGLQRKDLSDKARAELYFALGKVYDDLGNYAQAARHFRDGNAGMHRLTKWSRKAWRRAVEARLAAKPITHRSEPGGDFIPVFIVGMPRSGTTLLAELLSRCPGVCNRGELPWIARLAERADLSGAPDRAALQHATAIYAAQSRQDDAGDARWFIDKQPLNFRYIDLMLALFPGAKIIDCQRDARDTALSLWMQCFLEDVQGYSYDLGDIALVMRDEHRLMTHWRQRHADSIRTIRYEELVSDPDSATAALARWIGLPPQAPGALPAKPPASISTASLWQARQPVNTRSIGRWRNYAAYVPELLRFPQARK